MIYTNLFTKTGMALLLSAILLPATGVAAVAQIKPCDETNLLQQEVTEAIDLNLLMGRVWGIRSGSVEVQETWVFLPPTPEFAPHTIEIQSDLPHGLVVISNRLWNSIAVWQQTPDGDIVIKEVDDFGKIFEIYQLSATEFCGAVLRNGVDFRISGEAINGENIFEFSETLFIEEWPVRE